MIATGNSAIFSPHPGGKNTSLEAIRLINEAIIEAEGPPNVVVATKEAMLKMANKIMKHPKIDLLVATGGPGVVNSILSSGKKGIGAGPGNPPVLVDETADIPKAEKAIQTTIFMKNGPYYGGVGQGGEGFVIMSIAGPTGEGLTRPRTFIREQRCTLCGDLNLRSGI